VNTPFISFTKKNGGATMNLQFVTNILCAKEQIYLEVPLL